MPTLLLALLLNTSHADTNAAFKLDQRGVDVCATGVGPQEVCYRTVESAANGIDILSEVTQFERDEAKGANALGNESIENAQIMAKAAGAGLQPTQRTDLINTYDTFKLTKLASGEVKTRPTAADAAKQEMDVPFFAEVSWVTKAEPNHVRHAQVAGHLTLPVNDEAIDTDKLPQGELTNILSGWVTIDHATGDQLNGEFLRKVIAPATITHVFIAHILPELDKILNTITESLTNALSNPT